MQAISYKLQFRIQIKQPIFVSLMSDNYLITNYNQLIYQLLIKFGQLIRSPS